MKKEIRQAWYFKQSPQEVWKYLTHAELIKEWLGENDFMPVMGHKFCFYSEECKHTFCEVLKLKPFTELSYSWQKNSAGDGKPFNSIIEWTLLPKDNGTELQLVHSGFKIVEDTIAHEKGWNTCHDQLNKLLSNNHLTI